MDAMMAFRCDTQAHTSTHTEHMQTIMCCIFVLMYKCMNVLVFSYKYIYFSELFLTTIHNMVLYIYFGCQ